jgi:hypothetical protein
LRLYRSFHSTEERGEGKGGGLFTSKADFTVKFPKGEGVQINLSIEGLWERCMSKIFEDELESKKDLMRGWFHLLGEGEIRSATKRLGEGRLDRFGHGKPSIVGIQGWFQIFRLEPLEIDQQAPFSTIYLHFRIPFHNQEALVGDLELRKSDLIKYFEAKMEPKGDFPLKECSNPALKEETNFGIQEA